VDVWQRGPVLGHRNLHRNFEGGLHSEEDVK
jgi:hypothetical protein